MKIFVLLACFLTFNMTDAKDENMSFYDFTANDIDGNTIDIDAAALNTRELFLFRQRFFGLRILSGGCRGALEFYGRQKSGCVVLEDNVLAGAGRVLGQQYRFGSSVEGGGYAGIGLVDFSEHGVDGIICLNADRAAGYIETRLKIRIVAARSGLVRGAVVCDREVDGREIVAGIDIGSASCGEQDAAVGGVEGVEGVAAAIDRAGP